MLCSCSSVLHARDSLCMSLLLVCCWGCCISSGYIHVHTCRNWRMTHTRGSRPFWPVSSLASDGLLCPRYFDIYLCLPLSLARLIPIGADEQTHLLKTLSSVRCVPGQPAKRLRHRKRDNQGMSGNHCLERGRIKSRLNIWVDEGRPDWIPDHPAAHWARPSDPLQLGHLLQQAPQIDAGRSHRVGLT